MRTLPHERIENRRSLADTRPSRRRLYLCVPTFSDTAFDQDDQSASDPSSGDGTGRTATWVSYVIIANIRDINDTLIAYGNVPPGALIGDTLVSYNTRDKDAFRNGYDNENAYVEIDGGRYRIVGISTAGLGEIEEYLAIIRRFNPIWISPGH